MVHEPFLAFGEGSMKQNLAAVVHRVMVAILLRAASHVWVSIPDWETRLRPFLIGGTKSFGWLPVPSNIPVVDDPEGVAKIRAQYSSSDAALVGHFGAYDQYMTELMIELLPVLLNRNEKLLVMLLGKGSLELRARLVERHSDLSRSVIATGILSAGDISRHISSCDLMLQPYQDGVSGRRTSVTTALSHGLPVVSTLGKATESCWVESGAIKLTSVGEIAAMTDAAKCLLTNGNDRRSMSHLAVKLYRERFDLRHVVSALRQPHARAYDTLVSSSHALDN
jgi:glycosyltransferase involved in cell wall biosynthesis